MTGHLRPAFEGFSRILAGSVILHIIIIAFGAYMFGAPARKVFTPVYTVDLVAPGPKGKTKRQNKAPATEAAKEPAPIQKAEPVQEAPAQKAEPVKVKKAEEPVKKAAPEPQTPKETVKIKQEKAPAKEPVSISEKIKEIARKKEQEQEQEMLASKIEELKRQKAAKSEAVSQQLEDLKRRIASAPKASTPEAADDAAEEAGPGGGGGGPATSTGTRIGFAGRSGVTSENLHTKYREYYNIIQNRVDENWIYPKGFEYEKVTVIVSIRIGRNGNLIDSWLEESSGHRRFDDSLLSAIKKASPFPPLPVDFEGDFLEVGLRFCPDCKD